MLSAGDLPLDGLGESMVGEGRVDGVEIAANCRCYRCNRISWVTRLMVQTKKIIKGKR